jgi:DNA-binding PadR family transcriptional regulator
MDDQPIEDLELTPKMADVIKIFLADPTKARYGYELMRLTGQSSSYLYPTLAKFQKAGWLTAGKEDVDPHTAGRPPRRVYWISGAAVEVARVQLKALSERFLPPEPTRPRERYRPPKPTRPRLLPHGGTL